MSKLEFHDLAPVDKIDNGKPYHEALNWALNNKRIKNIALTGPYGSGKSSIIESFLSQTENDFPDKISYKNFCELKKSVLKISMASFVKQGDLIQDEMSSAEIEQGILKQLFYKVKSEKIPLSRYRKLKKANWIKIGFVGIVIYLVFLGAFSVVFPSQFHRYILDLKNTFEIKNFGFNFPTIQFGFALIAVVILISAFLYLLNNKFNITEISMSDKAKFHSCAEDNLSVFNRNLDEIVYFFEATKYRIIFFEDLDRLSKSDIFTHLRELNNLLNNDDAIRGKPVVFVYAVKDDIFSTLDRTKFFDFIIPVIPVMNSTNSADILLGMLDKGIQSDFNCSEEYIYNIGPFISDMRTLINIFNEFIVYKKTLIEGQPLSLSDEKMFSIIVFKNLYPKDFSDLQKECGIVKNAFDGLSSFREALKRKMQNEVQEYDLEIDKINSEHITRTEDLKYMFIGKYFRECSLDNHFITDQFEDIGTIEEFFKSDFDVVREFENKQCIKIRNRIHLCCGKNELDQFLNKYKEVERHTKAHLDDLKTKRDALNQRIDMLLLNSYKELLTEFNEASENLLPEDVKNNNLLIYLIRKGYIDESYPNYLNYFKGNSVTQEDMNFILSVRNRKGLPFNTKLYKIEEVINYLSLPDFRQKEIYNFDLLNSLLDTAPSIKLDQYIEQLVDEESQSWEFIDEFLDICVDKNHFISLLVKKWPNMCSFILEDEQRKISYERKVQYLKLIIRNAEDGRVRLEYHSAIESFLSKNADVLYKLEKIDSISNTYNNSERILNYENLCKLIEDLSIQFKDLDITGVSRDLLDYIFDNNHYVPNKSMIRNIVMYKDQKGIKKLENQPFTTIVELNYNPLLENVIHFATDYVAYNFDSSKNSYNDKSNHIVTLIKSLKANDHFQLAVIEQENFMLKSIRELGWNELREQKQNWKYVCDLLLDFDRLQLTWQNVFDYWTVCGYTKNLDCYLDHNHKELIKIDPLSSNDRFVEDVIYKAGNVKMVKRILRKFKYKNLQLDLSRVRKVILKDMIRERYFPFTADLFNQIYDIDRDLGFYFVLHNQKRFIEIINEIEVTEYLYEKIILEPMFSNTYKSFLFDRFAKTFMNRNIAEKLRSLNLPVDKEVFWLAFRCVDNREQVEVLDFYFDILDKFDVERALGEIGSPYSLLLNPGEIPQIELENINSNRELIGKLISSQMLLTVEVIIEKISNRRTKLVIKFKKK